MSFEIRRGNAEDVDRLEPLWFALRDHHAELPDMPGTREPEDSWQHRRAQYREWIAKPDFTLLLAERDDRPVGYAFVSIGGGASTWDIGEKTAEIETLSVLATERGAGVGRALVDAAVEVAREAGAQAVLVGVAHTNAAAIRFYEREGFGAFYALMLRDV